MQVWTRYRIDRFITNKTALICMVFNKTYNDYLMSVLELKVP